jgi:gliding motility-associated lipoprotein GldH
MKSLYLGLFLLLLSLSACDSGNYYQKYENMKLLDWKKSIPTLFQVDIKEGNQKMDLVIGFRYIPHIKHKELKFNLLTKSPSGKEFSKEYTVAILDANDQPLGSTMGEMSDLEKVIEPDFNFSEKGIYTFTVSQAMPEEDVMGIMEVGLIVKKK